MDSVKPLIFTSVWFIANIFSRNIGNTTGYITGSSSIIHGVRRMKKRKITRRYLIEFLMGLFFPYARWSLTKLERSKWY